jgi:integrase
MIYKRGKHWHMDVMVHGVRYREALDTTDRRQALGLEKERVSQIQQGKVSSPEGKVFARRPFTEAAGAWIETRKGHIAERSIEFERSRLRPLSAYFADKPLLKIRADDIRGYQKQRLDTGRSGKTINMEVGVLRLMMKRARTWILVADDVKMFPKHTRVIGRALTREQKFHLFRTASTREEWTVAYCAAVLAVSTTCRSVELKGLHWRDVDLFGQTIQVNRSKTEAGHRGIPLNADGLAALARLRSRAEVVGSQAPEHFVFPACENGHIDPARCQKSWRSAWHSLVKEATKLAGREAARAALSTGSGLGAAKGAWKRAAQPFVGFRFHDLRHQAITELAEGGATDATLMAVAGHLTREMLEHYSHVRMAAKRDAVAKLESGLMSPLPRESEGLKPTPRKAN